MSYQEQKEISRIERKLAEQDKAKNTKKLTPELLEQIAKAQGVKRYVVKR